MLRCAATTANRCVSLRARSALTAVAVRCGDACAEIYSTGKANLPGATRQRFLLASFARMVGQLLLHSSTDPQSYKHLSPTLRDHHKPLACVRDDAPLSRHVHHNQSTRRAAPNASSATPVLANATSFWELAPLMATGFGDGDGDAAAAPGHRRDGQMLSLAESLDDESVDALLTNAGF